MTGAIQKLKQMDNIYTEQQLWRQTEVKVLGKKDLIVFDLANPKEEFVLYGFDEVGQFTEGMEKPRYKFINAI